MILIKSRKSTFEDVSLNIKLKLATLWVSFMFLYIYVDYFALYKSGFIEGVIAGKVWEFQVTQVFLLAALVSVTVPALMIFLSVFLPAKVNRWTNIIISVVYMPYTLFNLAGEAMSFMIFGAFLEVLLLLLIVWSALNWPKLEIQVG